MPLYPRPGNLPVPVSAVTAGRYMFPVSPGTSSTTATLGVGTVRVTAFYNPAPISIDRLGAEITTIGEAGSKLRLGIWLDNGNAYPGALLLDGGVIAGDSATVQDLTVSALLPSGLIWIGGAVQVVVTTQPTVRITNAVTPPVFCVGATTTPTANLQPIGYSQASVTGAFGATFSSTVATTGSAPRCHIRIV